MVSIGAYPTPVRRLPSLSSPSSSLWVKHDDQTNPVYGGNKVRKVERFLADATARGAQEIVTVGAVGSNLVLTFGVHARRVGLRVSAIVVGQPRTPHVLNNLRADVAQHVNLLPARSYAHAALRIAERVTAGAYYVPAGGSNPIGAAGFVAAAEELAEQVRSGELPEPDAIVVALGSGGTAAGLVAGLAARKLRTRVVAVTVAEPPWFVEASTRVLALRCAGDRASDGVLERLTFTRAYLGAGYGHPTSWGAEAIETAATVGLQLEHTYTAKAFAAALDLVRRDMLKTVLYWHTLSSAPMTPLYGDVPEDPPLDPALSSLLRSSPSAVGGV